MNKILYILSIIFVCPVAFYFKLELHDLYIRISNNKDSVVLVIAVLSAQENFLQRQIARSTWLKNIQSRTNHGVKYFFIVGNQSCHIPPKYKLSEFSCETWNINFTDGVHNFHTHHVLSETESNNSKSIHPGFTFQVNHPVIVTKLGVHSQLLKENGVLRVAIMDIHHKEIVVEATLYENMTSISGYSYANVDEVLLPKNYEGLLLVEKYVSRRQYGPVSSNDGGGVVTFKRLYTSSEYLDSKRFQTNDSVAASIGFSIHDTESLKKLVSYKKSSKLDWLNHISEIEQQLENEIKEENDLFVVDLVDTYRTLPDKLLNFYKWLNSNLKFLYLIKADDDSVVDISKVLKQLTENEKFDSSKAWLWSRFRKHWPVNYIGKWADPDYKSSLYPAFPCGATYVMSHKTNAWLSDNAHMLFPYQGEDVSLGIWLSAINPELIDDDDFECDAQCTSSSYNRGQLTADQVKEAWNYYERCQNLCSCTE